MAISYPLSLPTGFHVTQASLTITRRTGSLESPFSVARQVFEWPNAAFWSMTLTGMAVTRREEAQLYAFLDAVHGPVGTILAGPKRVKGPLGTLATSGVTATGPAYANQVTLANCGAGATLQPGDLIQISSGSTARMHRIVTAAVADGSGNATVDIEPFLRASYVSAPVTTALPKTVWKLAGNAVPVPVLTRDGATVALALREAL